MRVIDLRDPLPHGRPTNDARLPAGDARLRRMTPADLPFVATQHLHHFPDGFFARLGPAFLAEYYRPFLTGPHAHAYTVDVAGRPVGFLVGVTHPVAHRQHVLRNHGRVLVVRAALSLLVRPRLALHFVRTRGRLYTRKMWVGRRTPPAAPVAVAERPAVLAHVVVAEGARSRGIGAALVERFVEDAAAAGCARISLVTAAGHDGAGSYYAERGWHAKGERSTPDGMRLATYERPVPSPEARRPGR